MMRTPPISIGRLASILFVQMLPATLVAPAIRPLFALRFGGQEGAMHAFMAVNMVGALLAAPFVGMRADRRGLGRRALGLLCVADGVLMMAVTWAPDVPSVLALRLVEGAAHVSATTLLLARAAGLARATGRGRAMGLAGAGLMLAIAAGSALGGLLVEGDPRVPFWAASAVSFVVGGVCLAGLAEVDAPLPARRRGLLRTLLGRRRMAVPVAAAFVSRFTVGTLVVTFALFANRAHGLSDANVGGLFALLTFPFALGTYPMGRLCDRFGPSLVLGVSAVVYAVCLGVLGRMPKQGLAAWMVVAGLASAGLFAPILAHAARFGGGEMRASAMSLVTAAGCLGMMLGPAAAGIVSHVVGATDPVAGYRAVFGMAAGAVALWLLLGARWLWSESRLEGAPRLTRTASSR